MRSRLEVSARGLVPSGGGGLWNDDRVAHFGGRRAVNLGHFGWFWIPNLVDLIAERNEHNGQDHALFVVPNP